MNEKLSSLGLCQDMESWSKETFTSQKGQEKLGYLRVLKFWLPTFKQPSPSVFLRKRENLKNVQHSKGIVYKDTALDPQQEEVT